MMPRTTLIDRKPLGQLLLNHGILQAEQLDRAIATQAGGRHQKLLGEILVEQNICTDEQITQTLALAYGVPYARLEPKLVDPKALALLPAAFVTARQVVPMFTVESVLTVAVPEPANVFLTEEIVRLSGLTVQVVAATARDIRATLAAMLPAEAIAPQATDIDDLIDSAIGDVQLPAADEAPSDRLIRYWLSTAIAQHGEQLSIEPGHGRSRIRLRSQGQWKELSVVPADLCRPAIDRLLEMAGLVDSSTACANGSMQCIRQSRAMEVAVSTTPTPFGPALLLRLADPTRPARLDKLGISANLLSAWQSLANGSGGLLLISGPVASGKSTTLHATVRDLMRDDRLIGSVENPLVQLLDGAVQTRVNSTRGFDMASATQSLLQSSVEVCLVDPMIESEVCQNAAMAASAGRLVLGTAAANDAATMMHRFRQYVGDDITLGTALAGVLSQRLVRKLCPACKQAVAPTDADAKLFGPAVEAVEALFTPRGCDQCDRTGYVGRTGLFELLIPDAELFERPIRQTTPSRWRQAIRRCTTHPMHTDILDKLRGGVTSVAEVAPMLVN